MEAGLDNSNNPFGMPNGANTDNIISQKADGLLLNLTDNFKQNGTGLPASDFFSNEKSNGKRSASDFDDDDFGPETDVDAVDDALSPGPKESLTKSFAEAFSSSPNNNLLADEGVFNPFMEHQEKAALEMEKNMRKRESREEFEEEERLAREETPTPPADTVHDVSGLVENPADSESEDEWNYFKGDDANKENISPQPEKEVADIPEEDDTMSQLNPNAAEFVPVSPTRSIPSPTCRVLFGDQILSQSPKKANDVDLSVPNLKEFENEVKSRPSEIDDTNGHSEESDLMENIMNGTNIDESSTPKKVFPSDEFHFGPNAAPFTPKLLDQSEALSTKAVYGDESVATLETSFNESINQDLNKESDPMSMSFYADKGDSNPFDLNRVQLLPDNLDEFLSKPDNETFNETISDLPEHEPLGEQNKSNILNNDYAIQITDLDKQSYDDEKELASPLEPEKELLATEDTDFWKTPELTQEHLLEDFCCVSNKEDFAAIPADVEIISPNPTPLQEVTEVSDLLSKEPTEVSDLLKFGPGSMLPDVEMIPEEIYSLNKPSKLKDLPSTGSPVPDFSAEPNSPLHQPKLEEFARLENKNLESAISDHSEVSDRPLSSEPQKEDLIIEANRSQFPKLLPPEPRPICRLPVELYQGLAEAVCDKSNTDLSSPEQTPVSPLPAELDVEAASPACDTSEKINLSRPPDFELIEPKPSRICRLPIEVVRGQAEAVCDKSNIDLLPPELTHGAPLQVELHVEAASPACDTSEKIDLAITREPIPEHFKLQYPESESKSSVCNLPESKSPIPEEPLSPDYTGPDLLEQAQDRFQELCKPLESPLEDVTSSVKDDLSSPVQDLLSKSPLLNQAFDDNFVKEEVADVHAAKVEESDVLEKESVPLSDVNALLDQALPAESAAPLPPSDVDIQLLVLQPPEPKICICPPKLFIREEEDIIPIDVKTETISPEFAEPTIVTPSEESKADDLIASTPEEPNKEPPTAEQTEEELKNEMTAVGIASAVAAGAAITAVVSATKVEEKKKSPSVSSAKKLAPTKTTAKSPSLTSKTSPKLSNAAIKQTTSQTTTSLKATTPKTGITKPPSTTTTPKASPRPNLSKPRTAAPLVSKTQPSKPAEKNPLANGEIKNTVRSTLTVRKVVSETNGTKPPTSRPTTASKITQNRLTTKPATTAAPKTTIPSRPAPIPRVASSAAAKRPTSLTNKTPSGTTSPDKTASTVKTNLSKTSPKSTTNVPPKPKPTTNTLLSKPRVPLTRTVVKAQPDNEKQIKDSANKITASRSIASARTLGSTTSTTARTALSSARRVESKVSATRTTVTKTTTTTTKSTTAKKPAELVKGTVIKTKTTKIEKPKENGISSTVVTEEITVVNNTNTVIDSQQPELVKDNSPVDNKLLIETTQLVETNAD